MNKPAKTIAALLRAPIRKLEYEPGSPQDPRDGEDDYGFTLQDSPCSSCAYRDTADITRCLAFPDGIPILVLTGEFEHTTPYDDGTLSDGGITYMPIEGQPSFLDNLPAADDPDGETVEKMSKDQPRASDGKWSKGSGWKKVGQQMGSNKGGTYENDKGEKHYVKFPNEPGQVRSEELADKVYDLMGVQSMQHKAKSIGGQLASVSALQDVKQLGSDGWKRLSDKQKQQAANSFVASALTKNWDVVGMTYDNMGTTKSGDIAIMDTGGSFNFRAQGGLKSYGHDAEVEIKAMLDPQKTSGRVFQPLRRENPEVFVKAAEKLKTIPDEKLAKMVKTSGIHNADKNAEAIVARKKAIIDYFGA